MSVNSIPASEIVFVTPGVLPAGGSALDLTGMLLTPSLRVPVNQVLFFALPASVGAYFGLSSPEYLASVTYFLGFDNSNKKPGGLYIAQYNAAPVAAYLRGRSAATIPLSGLQGISGTAVATIDGTVHTSSSFNLSAATSFTNAATIITTALGAGTVSWDALLGTFVLTSGTTGVTSSISAVSGAVFDGIGLSPAIGTTYSPGRDAQTAGGVMSFIETQTTNWATFTTTYEANLAEKQAFAAWNNGKNNRYLYVPYDTDPAAAQSNSSASFGAIIKFNNTSGTSPIYTDPNVAFMFMGSVASLDFDEHNGRATLAFRSQTGLTPSVTDATIARNLITNGYNFYGSYATANDQFNFVNPGLVSGPFQWADSYVCQIWLTNQLQLALMLLLTTAKSIPYNDDGYTLIRAALSDPVQQALNFGAIRAGVTLSDAQAAEVNSAAGLKIDSVLQSRGYYIQVLDANPQTRQARGSPPCTLWYTDGQSVQKINLASINVQ